MMPGCAHCSGQMVRLGTWHKTAELGMADVEVRCIQCGRDGIPPAAPPKQRPSGTNALGVRSKTYIRYHRLKSQGLCIDCGQRKAWRGLVRCQRCHEVMKGRGQYPLRPSGPSKKEGGLA